MHGQTLWPRACPAYCCPLVQRRWFQVAPIKVQAKIHQIHPACGIGGAREQAPQPPQAGPIPMLLERKSRLKLSACWHSGPRLLMPDDDWFKLGLSSRFYGRPQLTLARLHIISTDGNWEHGPAAPGIVARFTGELGFFPGLGFSYFVLCLVRGVLGRCADLSDELSLITAAAAV